MNDESACGKGVLYDINLYVCVCTGCVCGVGGGGCYVGGRKQGFPKASSVNPHQARIPRHRVQQGGTAGLNHAPAYTNTHTHL